MHPPKTTYTAIEETPHVESEQFPSRFSRTKWGSLLAIITGIWLSVTLYHAWQVTSQTPNSLNVTTVTRNLRILSEGVALLFVALITNTSSIVMWAAVSSKRGVTFSTWLAMSSSTGLIGLLKLFFWRSNPRAWDWHRLWITARYYYPGRN